MISAQADDSAPSFEPVPGAAGFAGADRAEAPLVPSAYLEHPAVEDVPHIDRKAAAVVLDRYLVRLSRHESVCRLRLGRLAARLLDSRAYHRLGFARLTDYAIERLGISGRELQSAARVWRAICAIPGLAKAYRLGQLNWTKLRILCEVVSEETADDWIVLAQTMSTRELAAHIAEHGKDQPPTGDGSRERAPVVVSGGGDVDLIDGEPRARIRIACPIHMRPLWREVFELASRSRGAVLASWQALEAVCAEALSAAPVNAGASNASADANPTTDGFSETDTHDGAHRYDSWESEFEELRNRVGANTGADLDVLETGLADLLDGDTTVADGTAPGNGKALDDPSAEHLDRALRAVLVSMQTIDWQLGRLLATFRRLSLHRHIGYRSMGVYVSERLGICERKARSLVRLERDPADGRGELAVAYRTGRISWLRALILLPVLAENNATAWIERATCVTVRRLQDEVRWALDMRDRTWPGLELEPPALGVTLEFSSAEAERQMHARYSAELIERIRQKPAETATSLHFIGPASVIALLHDALLAYRDPESPYEAAWKALERMLLHVKAQWQGVARHRNPIHEREGWRCRVPACSSRRNLQEHHVIFRSRGGDNARSNRISICAWHHLRGIHTGIVRAHGDAEHAIHWRLGTQLRLRDDVYVNA